MVIYIIIAVLRKIMEIFGVVTNIINIIFFITHGFKDAANVRTLDTI